MKKLSQWTRLPQIPEINKPPLLVSLTIMGLVGLFFYYLVFLEIKTLIWIIPFLIYHFLLYYSPRMMIAKDLFLKNLIEFKGKIIEVSDKKQIHPALIIIRIETSALLQQNLSQDFLILTPSDFNTNIIARLKYSKLLTTTFLLDHFIQQDVIFRSFQQSAFIFDLGLILQDKSGQSLYFFFKQLEYIDLQGKNKILKYKGIQSIQHHFCFKTQIHHLKIKYTKTEILLDCDQNQFFAVRQILTASHIYFL